MPGGHAHDADMPDDAVQHVAAPAPDAGTLSEGLRRLLAVEPEGRAPRRLVGALADALPAASCAALLVHDGEAFALAEGVGLDEAAPLRIEGGLSSEALAAGAVRLAADPGAPLPAGTRLGAAAPFTVGATRGALLVGTRGDPLDDAALLLLSAAADRIALLLERERLAREQVEALAAARRVEEEVERRRRAVDTILGIVGHDLRNPLGAVHMSAALLQKRGGLEGWQARTVERMRSSAGRMGRIIADLLTYTRTRLGTGIPIQRREADLGAVVGRVVDELRAANPDREIVVSPEGDLAGNWDPDRLEQVASNLVSNAVDHGDPGTAVRVRITGDADEVVLTVENTGPGMPPEVLAHVFEPFSRPPDERSRKASGLGLGLFISREIVRGHGGEIFARADESETAVTVRLPRGRDEASTGD
ncbi:MAG TPA: HAMP domain-containing sensor histidine kinase [Anaeromyxobacter sp.]